jgi:outer membrane lipoprotein LolB
MSLQVQDQPSDSFAAFFELSGSPHAGELGLFSPLGGTLAVLNWQPGRATLQAGSNVTQYESVDDLLRRASGTGIPVAALFDWLSGVQTQVPGWTADLSDWSAGRVQARRIDPLPEADLRVILDR